MGQVKRICIVSTILCIFTLILLIRQKAQQFTLNSIISQSKGSRVLSDWEGSDSKLEEYCKDAKFENEDLSTNSIISGTVNAREMSGDSIEEYFAGNKSWGDYTLSFLPIIIPLALISLFSFIGLFLYCCINFDCLANFDCLCKPKNGKEWDPMWPMYTLLIGAVLVTVCAVIGFVYIPIITDSWNSAKCGLSLFTAELLYGGNSEYTDTEKYTWKGLIEGSGITYKLKNEMPNANRAGDVFNTSYNLDADMYFHYMILDLHAIKLKGEKVTVVNPENGNTELIPEYGNNITEYVKKLSDEFWSIGGTCGALEQMKLTFNNFSSNYDELNEKITTGQFKLEEFQENITEFRSELYDNQFPEGDKIMDQMANSLYAYLIICILACWLVPLGHLLTGITGKTFWRCFDHISWITMSFFLVITFFVVTILFPVSVLYTELCRFMEDFFLEESLTEVANDARKGKIRYPNFPLSQGEEPIYLRSCLYGSADLYTEFGIYPQIIDIYNIRKLIMNATQSFASLKLMTWNETNIQYELFDSFMEATCNVSGESNKGTINGSFFDACDYFTANVSGKSSNTYTVQYSPGSCTSFPPPDATGGGCRQIGPYNKTDTNIWMSPNDLHNLLYNITIYNDIGKWLLFHNSVMNLFKAQDNNITYDSTLVPNPDDPFNQQKIFRETVVNLLGYILQRHNDTIPLLLNTTELNFNTIPEAESTLGNMFIAMTMDPESALNCSYLRKSWERGYESLCKATIPSLAAITVVIMFIGLFNIFNVLFVTCITRAFALKNRKRKKTIPEERVNSKGGKKKSVL